MESLFDYLIFLIPVAILIGRGVLQFRNRRNPAPQPVAIPVHFEDEEAAPAKREKKREDSLVTKEEENNPYTNYRGSSEYFRELNTREMNVQAQNMPRIRRRNVTPAPSVQPAKRELSFSWSNLRLGHLPPLKQAVVMSEILGPPKGLE